MLHTTLQQKEQSWIALDLNSLDQPFPDQVNYLIDRVRDNSHNFDQEGTTLLPNSAHLFLKLHLLTESSTLVTLALVDLAGYPEIPSRNEGNTEINNSINYLLYLFRDMMHSG